MLGFDATLEAGYGFWEHLYSLTEVKGLIVTRLWRWLYKFLRLPIILLYVEMIVGSLSGESQFKTYGWPNSILVLWNLCSKSVRSPTLAVHIRLPFARIEYVLAFQIWCGKLCVKKLTKRRQKILFSFLFSLEFSQLNLSWKFELFLPHFESFEPSLLCYYF